MTSERLIALVMSRFDPFRRGAETPKGDCPRVRPARQGTGIICITNHAILPSTKHPIPLVVCSVHFFPHPLMPSGRVGLFSHDGVSPRTFLVTTWPLGVSVCLTLAAFRHWRLLSSRGNCLAADFRREQRFAASGVCPLTPFGRVGLFSHDGISPRTFLVITRPLSASVNLTLAAFRHWRLLSSRGNRLAADFRREQRFAASGVCPLTPFGRVGLFSHDGVSPRTSLVITRPLSASVNLTLAAFRHWRHSSLRVVRA